MNSWTEKQARKKEFEINKLLDTGGDKIDFEGKVADDVRDAAMGKGEEELFEKKLSKEEKKALAKAKREAKKKVRITMNVAICRFYISCIEILEDASNESHETGKGR